MQTQHCPKELEADPLVVEVFAAYRRYVALDRRFLPRAGGLEDQDALTLDGLGTLALEASRIFPQPFPGLPS